MTVSRFDMSGVWCGTFFFSALHSCFLCIFGCPLFVLSFLVILRDDREGARLLVGTTFLVDDSDVFDGIVPSFASTIFGKSSLNGHNRAVFVYLLLRCPSQAQRLEIFRIKRP